MPTPDPSVGLSESSLRLHHGTDETSARDLLRSGVNQAWAAVYNSSGEFWATTAVVEADNFAQVNPAGGVPARFSFSLPRNALQTLLTASPPRAYQHTLGGVN